MFDLKQYAWDMWCMAKAAHDAGKHKDVGVEIGTDLFLQNVRAGKAENPGAAEHDWGKLEAEWKVLTDKEQVSAIGAYNDAISNLGEDAPYPRLAAAFTAGDKEAFMAIIASR